MLIDITLEITPTIAAEAKLKQKPELEGHLGTHFDVMNKAFPLSYTKRQGVVFDVSSVRERDITAADIDMNAVKKDMFVAFYTGFIEEEPYGTRRYFAEHPQLADTLIDTLVERGVSIIALDCAGVRRGKEHTPKDRYCAEHGVFVVENLANLKVVLQRGGKFTAHTYPMHFTGLTGLPCRVIAEV